MGSGFRVFELSGVVVRLRKGSIRHVRALPDAAVRNELV